MRHNFILFTVFCSLTFIGFNQSYFGKTFHDSVALQFNRYEIGLQLDLQTTQSINRFLYQRQQNGINPFNPKDINLEALFIAPSGKETKRYGFYYQFYKSNEVIDKWEKDTTTFLWRIRFAPDELGQWKVKIAYNTKTLESDTLELNFNCLSSDHKGYLIAEKDQRYLQFKKESSSFFTIGNNISSGGFYTYKPSQNSRHLNGVQQLINVGGNFTRFDMQPQAALPDWPNIYNYANKLDEMFAFDKMVDICEKNNVYFILFRHHIELMDSRTNPGGSDWSGVSWFDNPYQQELHLKDKKDYFNDSTALIWQKNSLRYVLSRWGYSPNFAFYGYSEVDNWVKDLIKDEKFKNSNYSEEDGLELFNQWVVNQQEYIKELAPNMLFSNSYSVLPDLERKQPEKGILSHSDIISIHDYETIKDVNYKNRYDAIQEMSKKFHKPVLLEEMGVSDNKLRIYCCTGIEYHNSVWASAMSGGTGTGLDWWWDRGVQDFGYHLDLLAINDFFDGYNLNKMNLTPQKWSDASVSKRLLENFALVSEQKDTIFGWIHNATFYWRNLTEINPCIKQIVDSSKLSNPCYVGENYDLNVEQKGDYQAERFYDDYTLKGGAKVIKNQELQINRSSDGVLNGSINDLIQKNPTFKIKDLKRSIGRNREWYKIVFYHPLNGNLITVLDVTQLASTSLFGTIKFHIPNMYINSPDYAYKVYWVGKTKGNKGLVLKDL